MNPNHPLSDNFPAARLILEDGSAYPGRAIGFPQSVAGEVVFNTGMTGYPEAITDPSYRGQILTFTYPLIGNYGIGPQRRERSRIPNFESAKIQVQGIVLADYSSRFSHPTAMRSLSSWLHRHRVPGLVGIDTRTLTRKLREKGTMLGKIEFPGQPVDFFDPDLENMVRKVSIKKPVRYGEGARRVALIDCGCKFNIIRSLLKRNLSVVRVPWDYNISRLQVDGVVISNGPGNPKTCRQTVLQIRASMERGLPILGICMGHQLMALAAGANTYKLKFGHRGQNQPVREVGTHRCLVTSQNHGFAVDNHTLPEDWQPWFINLNDGTNEGLHHKHLPFLSVQFHPEANPGPVDAEFVFDEFLKHLPK